MIHSGNEAGWNSALTIVDDEMVKVSLRGFPTEMEAADVAADLSFYAAELDEEPLRVATLKEVQVVEGEKGYHVRHRYDLVDGPSIVRMAGEPQHEAVADVLGQVADMRTIGGPDTLVTPFDAKSENFHVDDEGAALTDIFPALTRLEDGSFPLEVMGQGRGSYFPWSMGTKTGAMVKILSTAVARGDSAASKLRHIAVNTDNWCYDALPGDMDPGVKENVRKQIRMHFVPYLARIAGSRVLAKTGL